MFLFNDPHSTFLTAILLTLTLTLIHKHRWRSGYVIRNGLVGTWFASRHRLQPKAGF